MVAVSVGSTADRRSSLQGRILSPAWTSLAVLTLAGTLLRLPQTGNPLVGLDEQFYLLVGDRMWDGAMPYVDIWDRKPVGLFLLFALVRLLPGDGVVASQLVATGCAIGTAVLLARFTRAEAGWTGGTFAGLIYLAGLNQLWGETTQTPVLYGLPVMAAALLTRRALAACDDWTARRAGSAAMLLAGVAIQIKTSAVFEGAWFGSFLAIAALRLREGPVRWCRHVALLALAGLAPTLLAAATYAALGHGDAWWFANVTSSIAKGRPNDLAAWDMASQTALLIAPALLLALSGLWVRTARFTRIDAHVAFLLGWAVVAAVDAVALGGYYPHYAIPLLLAGTVMGAPFLALPRTGPAVAALLLCWPVAHALLTARAAAVDRGYAREVLDAIPADVRTECMFIYEGPPIYYHLTDACLVSRYAFTKHLSSGREAAAIGIDPLAGLRKAFVARPGTVVTMEHSESLDPNPAAERLLVGLLAHDYHLVARLPHRYHSRRERLLLWRRRDLPAAG